MKTIDLDVVCIVEHIYRSSKPVETICGIPLHVVDPDALPPGVCGVLVDPLNPSGAVFLKNAL